MSDAQLRYELAGALGRLASSRDDIIAVAEQKIADFKREDLPEGTPRSMWLFILQDRANQHDAKGVESLLAFGAERSKKVDWTRYNRLAAPPAGAAPAIDGPTRWSLLALEMQWQGDSSALRTSSDPVILEALVTLQWEGGRPAGTPTLAVSQGSLGGTADVPTVLVESGAAVGLATWIARFPVEPGALLSRRIRGVATFENQRRVATRRLMSFAGAWLSTGLWFALAAFVVTWLYPFGTSFVAPGIALGAAGIFFNLLLPRFRELSLGWLTQLWETTALIVAVLSVLVIFVPRYAFIMVTNYSSVAASGVDPGERKTFLRGTKPKIAEATQQICPDTCKLEDEDVRGVPHYEIRCISGDRTGCKETRGVQLASYARNDPQLVVGELVVPLDYPTGFHPLAFTPRSFSSMTTRSGDREIRFSGIDTSKVRIDTIEVPVLVDDQLAIELGSATMVCSGARNAKRIDLVDVTPLPATLQLKLGDVTTNWSAKDGPHIAPRACFASAKVAELQLDELTPGQRIALPKDLGIERVTYGKALPVECADPSALRAVRVLARTDAVTRAKVARVEPKLGVTCSAPEQFRVGPIACSLTSTELKCEPGKYRGPCFENADANVSKGKCNKPPATGNVATRIRTNANVADKRAPSAPSPDEEIWTCTTVYQCQ